MTSLDQASTPPAISVVVPVYREETNIVPFLNRLVPVLEQIGTYEVLFCLDPSPDRTEDVICEQITLNPRIGLLVFSRRFGQPAATAAGVLNCAGETCVIIDVDLQDPPELLGDLYTKLQEGYDVVYARRRSRQGETLPKRLVSHWGYKLINAVADIQIPRDTGDFRIINRRVIEELRSLPESHGFLRGLVAFVGLRQSFVEYDRDARAGGAGKYNRYLGSLKIAFNGLFGFSTYPLSFLLWMGVAIALLSVPLIVAMFMLKAVYGEEYPMGIPTITVLVLFLGGVQLVAIGVIGEYVGRIYQEVRRRPRFILDRVCNVPLIDDGRWRPDGNSPIGTTAERAGSSERAGAPRLVPVERLARGA